MINTKRMMVLDNSHRITVTNCLTPNQSDGGDSNNPELLTLNQRTGTDTLGDTTGFNAFPGPETLTSSTEQAHTGTRSLKITTPGNTAHEGYYTGLHALTTNTTYNIGAWVLAPNGQNMILSVYDSAMHILLNTQFTGTGTWQYIEGNFTTDTTHPNIYTYIRTDGTNAITFYVDDLRLATNTTTGFIPLHGGVVSISPKYSYQGYRSCKVTTPGSVSSQEGIYIRSTISQTTSMVGQARVWVPSGRTLHYIFTDDAGHSSDGNVTGNDDWNHIFGTYSSSTTIFILYLYFSGTVADSFYVDSCMLETGDTAHDWIIGQGSYSFFRSRE